MNYIYDITLNLKNKLYNFYEWKDEDYPIFVLKIPVFKINKNDYFEIKNNNIKVNKDFLKMIYNQTEVYAPDNVINMNFVALFACSEDVIAIEFDENGKSVKKSVLSFDEETEVLDVITLLKMNIIDYTILSNISNKITFKTRNEIELMNKLEDRLKNIMESKDYKALKYIFYELYKSKSNEYNKMYIKLLNIIKNSDERSKKIEELFTLIDTKKIPN